MMEQYILRLILYGIAFVLVVIAYKMYEYARCLDAYAKFRNKKLIKIRCFKWFFITTNFFGKKEYVGIASFIIQIVTNLLFTFYILVAILDVLIFQNMTILSLVRAIMFGHLMLILMAVPFIGITVNNATNTNGVKELKELEKTHIKSNDFLQNSIKKNKYPPA